MKTIFTKIIEREIPAYILYEDDFAISFLDIEQATKGHVLVVSKEPFENFFETPNPILIHLLDVAKKIGYAIEKGLGAKGFNILTNCGEIAGQTVLHFHLHIIPRYDIDEFRFKFKKKTITSTEYENRAHLIKSALL